MCVLIVQPKGSKLTRARAQECFSRNPDGAGFAYASHGRVVVRKGLMTFGAFWKAYRAECAERSAIVHFRIATSGGKGCEMTHPFRLSPTAAFAHNGIIHSLASPKASDTANLAALLQRLPPDHADIQTLLEALAHESASKFAIIFGTGRVAIFNHRAGTEIDGLWYSNTLWRPISKPTGKAGDAVSYRSPLECSGAWGWDDEQEGYVQLGNRRYRLKKGGK